jgi:8-oxo-dGTP diphosphatase
MVGLDELTIVAGIRALFEDTGVEASAAAFLFQQVSAHHLHHVFRVAIPDDVHPQPAMGGGLDEVVWAEPAKLAHISTTPGTRAILNRALGLGFDATKPAWKQDDASGGISRRWR